MLIDCPVCGCYGNWADPGEDRIFCAHCDTEILLEWEEEDED